MDDPVPHAATSPPGPLRRAATGLGNLLGFFAAAVAAVVEVLRGRWDGPQRRRGSKLKGMVKKIAPFPIDD